MLTKMVDGVIVIMSAEEESIILAEWMQNDPSKNHPPTPEPSIADLEATILNMQTKLAAAGINVNGGIVKADPQPIMVRGSE